MQFEIHNMEILYNLPTIFFFFLNNLPIGEISEKFIRVHPYLALVLCTRDQAVCLQTSLSLIKLPVDLLRRQV